MKVNIALSILVLASLLVGCGAEELVTPQEEEDRREASLLERSLVHGDSLRTYLLYVPAAYDGEDDWPLVINYHGYSIDADFQMEVSQMNAAADTEHFLIAYPQGLLVDNPLTGTTGLGWNILGGTLSENDDSDFSLELIDHVDAAYEVDRSRVHVTGWSMGAAMAYEMACAYPDQIASVAGVANQMSDDQIAACTPGRAMSFLQIHGTADPIVPFDGIQSGDLVFSAAPETASFWAEQNDCSPDPLAEDIEDVVAEDNSTVALLKYTGCDHSTEVLFYRVNNGGHTWPQGSFPGGEWPEFLGPVNRDINASAEIWDFFARNPHPARIN